MSQELVALDNKEKKVLKAKAAKVSEIELYNRCLQLPEFKRPETKEKVIDEDKYLKYLQEIITRDYFPSLIKSQHENDKDIIPEDISIDNYMANFSSDELESIKDIIYKDNQKRLKKQLWMYKEEDKDIRKHSLLSSSNDSSISKFQYAKFKTKNSLYFPPSTSTDIKLLGHKRDNSDYSFVDESIENDSKFNGSTITKENTRLPNNFIEKMEDDHINKVRKKMIETYENSDLVKLMKEMKDNKEINGYNLIKDPKYDAKNNKMTLASGGDASAIPLVFTWGEIASTPMIIKEKNQFQIPQTPQRETIAYDLVSKINTKKSESRANINQHINSSNNQSALTPGGLKLLNSIKRNNISLNRNQLQYTKQTDLISTTPQRRLSSIRITKKDNDL